MDRRIVIALGGNSLQENGEALTYENQMRRVAEAVKNILPLVQDSGSELVITHGNGPQVGNILIQNARAKASVPAMPMFVCGAMSQGMIGYFIQQSLADLLSREGRGRDVLTVVTQVVVDKNDPAFMYPSKPVGPFYNKAEAEKLAAESGHIYKEDSGRGWRRVVPSPEPMEIVELGAIKELLEKGMIVVAAGGGGIPVIKGAGGLAGSEAVIDKDKASAVLAHELDAELFIILTAVEKVSLGFGTPAEKKLDTLSATDARIFLERGEFAPGSMKPKIEAAIGFVNKNHKRRVLITHARVLEEALAGKNGTWING